MSEEYVHFVLTGRVQHVGYRRYVVRQANLCGIKGWVRNNADSTVEVVAFGDVSALATFLQKAQTGPLFAKVLEVRFITSDSPDIIAQEKQAFGFNVRFA